MKECEENLSTLREEYQQLEEEFNKMKSEEVDVKNDLEKCDSQVKDNESKIKYWKREVGIKCQYSYSPSRRLSRSHIHTL
jgi:predicted  nucleic acid-binding Zn-ribbon protein